MLVRVTIAIALLLLPTTLQAQVEKRIALLIGNKDYKAGVGALTNPSMTFVSYRNCWRNTMATADRSLRGRMAC